MSLRVLDASGSRTPNKSSRDLSPSPTHPSWQGLVLSIANLAYTVIEMRVGLIFDSSSLSYGTFQLFNPKYLSISFEMSVDPRIECQSRLSDWSRRVEGFEQSHTRIGNFRVFFLFGLLALGAVFCRSANSWGAILLILVVGLVLMGI